MGIYPDWMGWVLLHFHSTSMHMITIWLVEVIPCQLSKVFKFLRSHFGKQWGGTVKSLADVVINKGQWQMTHVCKNTARIWVLRFLHCTHCAYKLCKHSAYNVDAVLHRFYLYERIMAFLIESFLVFWGVFSQSDGCILTAYFILQEYLLCSWQFGQLWEPFLQTQSKCV